MGGEARPFYDFLESCLRHKSEVVIFEAARAICNMRDVSSRELTPAVTVLQLFLSSSKPVLRFAAVRTLNKVRRQGWVGSRGGMQGGEVPAASAADRGWVSGASACSNLCLVPLPCLLPRHSPACCPPATDPAFPLPAGGHVSPHGRHQLQHRHGVPHCRPKPQHRHPGAY